MFTLRVLEKNTGQNPGGGEADVTGVKDPLRGRVFCRRRAPDQLKLTEEFLGGYG